MSNYDRLLISGGRILDVEDIPPLAVNTFERVVVVAVLDNVSLLTDEYIQQLGDAHTVIGPTATGAAALQDVPRNSILGRFSSYGKGRAHTALYVFYPFFSSHFSLPLKPGEQVWVMYPEPGSQAGVGYWMSRVTCPVDVEDANYTHYDREAGPLTPEAAKEYQDHEGKVKEAPNPGFPNGPNHVSTDEKSVDRRTLLALDDFEEIQKDSLEKNDFIIEPVPRFTKRPGDLVLQGSNNATIILGTDRGYKKADAPDGTKSNANLPGPLEPGKGAIDIVVGRGRINDKLEDLAKGAGPAPSVWPTGPDGVPDPPPDLEKPPGKPPVRTMPQVVQNARETYETDKNVSLNTAGLSNLRHNASEGDPDFDVDAARAYLTLKSNPDADFSLVYPQCPTVDKADNVGVDVKLVHGPEDKGSASIVHKADEIRIIARQAEKDTPGAGKKGIQGSIKIIKEGEPDDEAGKGRAVIMMQPDGVIMIDGPKIVIGSGLEKGNGEGTQLSIGLGATEPLVLGNELKTLLETFFDKLKEHLSTVFDAHVHPTGTGPSGPPAPLSAPGQAAIDQAKADLVKILSKMGKLK